MKHPPILEHLDLDKAVALLQAGINYLEHNERDWVRVPHPKEIEAVTMGPGRFGPARGYIGLGIELFVNPENSKLSDFDRTPDPPNWDRLMVGIHLYAEDGRRSSGAVLPYNRDTGSLGLDTVAQQGLIISLFAVALESTPK